MAQVLSGLPIAAHPQVAKRRHLLHPVPNFSGQNSLLPRGVKKLDREGREEFCFAASLLNSEPWNAYWAMGGGETATVGRLGTVDHRPHQWNRPSDCVRTGLRCDTALMEVVSGKRPINTTGRRWE